MDWKEMIQRYRQGIATDEEKQIVQEEMEKWKLFDEYFTEQEDWPLLTTEETEPDLSQLKQIQKGVKKKLAAAAAIAVLTAILIFIAWFYAVPSILNQINYNPNEGYQCPYGNTTGQFYIDISTFTELHFPAKLTTSAKAVSTGAGCYQLEIRQMDAFHRRTPEIYTASLERGIISGLSPLFWSYPYINAFVSGNYPVYPQLKDSHEHVKSELEALPETAQAMAYLSFEEDVDMETIINLRERLRIDIPWVGVRIAPPNKQTKFIGFQPSGDGIVLDKDFPDENQYPYFELAYADDEEDGLTAEKLEIHFQSILKYMLSRPEFLEAIGMYPSVYENALTYTQENGIRSYGILASGSSKELLSLIEEPWISGVRLEDIRLSSYSK